MSETGQKKNVTLIIALISIAALGLCCLLVLPAILFPVFAQAKLAAKWAASMTNAKSVNLSLIMYTTDNNDTLPMKENWVDATTKYRKSDEAMTLPIASSKDDGFRYDLAFYAKSSGKRLSQMSSPASEATIFESGQNEKNQFGGWELLPDPPRYKQAAIVGYGDGHVKSEKVATLKSRP